MLLNRESIQIRWLFRMERAISLNFDFNHFSVLRGFNEIVRDLRELKTNIYYWIYYDLTQMLIILNYFAPVISVHHKDNSRQVRAWTNQALFVKVTKTLCFLAVNLVTLLLSEVFLDHNPVLQGKSLQSLLNQAPQLKHNWKPNWEWTQTANLATGKVINSDSNND